MTESETPPSVKRSILSRLGRAAVSKILMGSLIGQGAVLIASPLLTRLYSPSDFAALAVITAVSTVLGSVATLSWERAVVVPAEEAQARSVMKLGFLSLAMISISLFGVFFVLRSPLADMLGSDVLIAFWWLVPATVAIMGVYSLASASLVRSQSYSRLAARNATLGLSQAGSSVALGLFGVTPFGLISSIAVGRAVALVGMLRLPRRDASEAGQQVSMRDTARRYRKFPLVNTWSRLLNSLGLQLPVILIVSLFGSVEAGLYALTLRVLAAPVGVISDAVSQYFEGAFAKRYRSEESGLRALMRLTTLRLALVGLLPVVTVLAFGPQLFSLVFGSEWAVAGEYARVLVMSYFAQLVVSPISRALVIVERQGTQLIWDASRLVATSAAVLVTALSGFDFIVCALALSVVQVVWYVSLLLLSLSAAAAAEPSGDRGE